MLKTKIYGTIGSSSYQAETLIKMINKGMNGIRINLSHGDLHTYKKGISNIKEAELKTDSKITIIADIQGPEIRVGSLKEENISLYADNNLTLIPGVGIGDNKKIFISWPEKMSSIILEDYLRPGEIILIDDGLIKLEIISTEKNSIKCRILRGGILNNRKGINIPGVKLPFSSLTEKDKYDIKFGIELGIDFIMLPFTRSIEDVELIRNYLDSKGGKKIRIFSKIENHQGVDNLDAFIDSIDGVVIARGDLGVEIGLFNVPFVQKELIKICNKHNKESIVVTHMLHSMINSPLPTRAEINDIANCILDGCSSVMLTGETAIGKFPVESIEILHNTVVEAEKWKQ